MEIIRNLFRRKLRTFLTVFGITIGVFVLVVMGGMAEKMNLLLQGATRAMENNVLISPEGTDGGFFGGSIFSASLAEDLKKVEGVQAVSSSISVRFDEEMPMIVMGMLDTISGINISEQHKAEKIMDPHIRLAFTSGDWWEKGDRGVAVIGSDLARKLEVSVGDSITNRGKIFQVTGILRQTMTGPDNIMYVPLEDARELLVITQPILEHLDMDDYITFMTAVVHKEDAVAVAERITEQVPGIKAYPPDQLISDVKQGMLVINLVILASAFIALMVGSLSVINTMLMSVTERIREIGIKKAVGAGNLDIVKEYILESSLIGLMAGLIGLGLGSLFIVVINASTAQMGTSIFTLTPRLAIGSLIFACFLAVFAGLFPAYRAAATDPIQALKNE